MAPRTGAQCKESMHVMVLTGGVPRAQVWVGVVPVGPKGVVLNSSYATRTSPAYMEDLGLALANWARIVPDGLLVFFASYSVLDACMRHWKSSSGEQRGSGVLSFNGTLWDRIVRDKQAVVEPRVSPPAHLPAPISTLSHSA